MSKREKPGPELKRRAPFRLPNASYTALIGYLDSLNPPHLDSGIARPSSMRKSTWDQVHATLSSLGLISDAGGATIALHRVVRGELSLARLLKDRYGDIVEAITSGSEGPLLELEGEPYWLSTAAITRFASLVRAAIASEGGSPPSVRRPRRRPALARDSDTPEVTTWSTGGDRPSAMLLRREAESYLAAIEQAVKTDLSLAAALQQLFHAAITRLRECEQ